MKEGKGAMSKSEGGGGVRARASFSQRLISVDVKNKIKYMPSLNKLFSWPVCRTI
jgi:hypothetical protein